MLDIKHYQIQILRIVIAFIYTTIAIPVSAEITKGNLIPSGPIQLQCWQYGNKIIDEKGLQQMNTASLSEPGTMYFRTGKDLKGAVLLVPTASALCLVKNEN